MNVFLCLPQLGSVAWGCGGGITFVDLAADREPVRSSLRVTPGQISHLMARLMAMVADDYRRVGGFHTAGLGVPSLQESDVHQLLVVATDIGRHNTLDKVAGECLARDISMREAILLTTGRVSVEMLGKARRLQTERGIEVGRQCFRRLPPLSLQSLGLWCHGPMFGSPCMRGQGRTYTPLHLYDNRQ